MMRRVGMTLVELLVVIFIVLTVTALAIPVIAPAMRGRQVREASRIVTAYLAGARAEALKTGRPVGVVFETLQDQPEWCFNLSQCKEPTPYAGDTIDARLAVGRVRTSDGRMLNGLNGHDWLLPTDPLARVHAGDLIKFNYQGHLYQLAFDTVDSIWYLGTRITPDVWAIQPDPSVPPTIIPEPTGTPPPGAFMLQSGDWNMHSATTKSPAEIAAAAYQVFRQPKRSDTAPVQLPAGVVIDMNYSGDDIGPFVIRDRSAGGFPGTDYENDPHVGTLVPVTGSITVMFSPNGLVEKLYRHNSAGVLQAIRPTGQIHFLLGERERVPVTAVETLAGVQSLQGDAEAQIETFNYQDLDSFWITINPRSGKVDSTENSASTPIANPPATPIVGPIADGVRQSRIFATEGKATSSQQ